MKNCHVPTPGQEFPHGLAQYALPGTMDDLQLFFTMQQSLIKKAVQHALGILNPLADQDQARPAGVGHDPGRLPEDFAANLYEGGMVIISVTALSTIAMVVYPVFVTYLAYDNVTAGVFLGATIHDVAQVVGAGYIISDQSGEISTLVKLIRVACLVPVVVVISLITHRSRADSPDKRPLLPWFLVAFVLLVIVNSMGWVPDKAHMMLTPVSSWCLLTAVAALGVKTSLKALTDVGPAPVGVMVLQTLLLAALVLGGLALI